MAACPIGRPDLSTFAPYQQEYIKLVTEPNVLTALVQQQRQVVDEWSRIDPQVSLLRHVPYTWSLREVVGHIMDGERIFGYRTLRFARGDRTELPGFEENDYVRNAQFDRRDWRSLIDEFDALRRANILMLENLPEQAWQNSGRANNIPLTVHGLAYLMVGHVRHHQNIIRKRLSETTPVLV